MEQQMTRRSYAVAIDLDGVVADFITPFRDEVRREYCIEIQEEDIRAHDLHLALGVGRQEARILVLRTLDRPDLQLYPGAEQGLRQLVGSGVDVHLVTARGSWQGTDPEHTTRWLADRGIQDQVHYKSLDETVEGRKYAVAAHFDCIVDDNLAELTGAMEHRGDVGLLIVYEHPWNRCLDARSRLTRVEDWETLVRAIGAARACRPPDC